MTVSSRQKDSGNEAINRRRLQRDLGSLLLLLLVVAAVVEEG